MKTVAALPFERAHLLRANLEDAGLRVVLLDESGGAMESGAPLVRIQVRDEEFEQALQLVAEFDSQMSAPIDHPELHADPSRAEHRKRWAIRLDWLLVGLSILALLALWVARKIAT
jgi:hypothetical protein